MFEKKLLSRLSIFDYSRLMKDLNLFKKNGFIVKENLISQAKINKINKIINEVISKEKKRKKGNGANGTQSYDNYHFVYNSGSSKNKEILRLNNPQNRHKIFYELSRDKSCTPKAKGAHPGLISCGCTLSIHSKACGSRGP